jgi:CheY-like chemotaxis protein
MREIISLSKLKKILILDDESAIRFVLHKLIERAGPCEIYEAATLKEASSLCEEHKFDLVFLDHHIPDGIGWEIADKIRENPEKYGTPKIVGMSGSIVYNSESNFFDTYIEKPFSIKELMPTISKAISESPESGQGQ